MTYIYGREFTGTWWHGWCSCGWTGEERLTDHDANWDLFEHLFEEGHAAGELIEGPPVGSVG